MTELDRFTEFLRREAAGYHAPPEPPVAEMWTEISTALVQASSEIATAIGAGRDPLDSSGYHEPPETPREDMWGRIEAAWALRRSAPEAGREAGLEPLEDVRITLERRPRRSVAMWMTGVAVAASLALGVALGRGSLLLPTDGAQVAVAPPASVGPGSEVARETAGTGDSTLLPAPLVSEPLESSDGFVDRSSAAAGVTVRTDAAGSGGERSAPVASRSRLERRQAAARYATSDHMGRAATLLTAFRADASAPAEQGELASWARELLGETRLLLDLDVTRSPTERGLLQDLELVLAQIARLGPGAPDFERDLIRDGIDRQGTLNRLRSATSVAGT